MYSHCPTDQATSSSRKRRKHWSEIQHNESIDEMMERLANTPPVVTANDEVVMETGDDHVTSMPSGKLCSMQVNQRM